MKRFLSLILLLFVLVGARADTVKALVVSFTDGSKATYVLSSKPVITFSGTNVLFKSNDASTEYAMSNVKEFHFEDVESGTNAVSSIKEQNGVRFTFVDGVTVKVSGVDSSADVKVYDLQGRAITVNKSFVDGEVTISVESLNVGTYVVSACNKSIKILKK